MRKLSLLLVLLFCFALPIRAQVNPITGNITASAACQATSSSACVIQRLPANTSSVAVTASGTFSATLAPEQSADGGNTWTSAGSSITSPGSTTYTISAQNVFRVRASAYSSGTATVSISYSTASGGGGGAPSGPAGGAQPTYWLAISGSTITATPNRPGLSTYTGTDLTPVIANVMTALTPTCGRIYFNLGVYPVNTLALESTGGFSNYYVMGLPPAAATNQYCKWIIDVETTTPLIDQFGTGAQTSGVIFNVTSTALATVTTTSKVIGIWGRPDVANGVGPVVSVNGIDVRFPDNQRGCESGIDLTQVLDVDIQNSMVDTPVAQASLLFPVEASCTAWGGTDRGGLEGILTPNSQKEETYLRHDYALGADEGLDIRGEHVVMIESYAANGNYGIEYGVQTGAHNIDWSSQFINVGCSAVARCLTLGSHLDPNSLIDISGLTFEDKTGTFAPVYHVTETNSGFSYGRVSWQQTGAAASLALAGSIFDGGGGISFDQRTRAQAVYNPGTFQDVFNQSTPGFWWTIPTFGTSNPGLKISSGSVLVNSASTASGSLVFRSSNFNTDQYSKATISAMDSGASSFAAVYTNMQNYLTTFTYYEYACGGAAAIGNQLLKQVAGSATTLSSQTSGTGCATNDIIELRNSNGLICAYRNGKLEVNLNPPCVTDTTITGGYPAIGVGQTSNGGVSLSNWFGGNLTNLHGPDSIYGQPGAWTGQQSFNAGLLTKLYTVSSGTTYPALPSASSVPKGTALWVTDSTSIAPGTCVGGSTHWVMAISDGSAWNCP